MEASPELAAQDISVHVITAQPGGPASLQDILVDKKSLSPPLPSNMKLSSDPEHKLLLDKAGDIYTIKTMDQYPTRLDGTIDSYEMVQPAMVVLDSDGNVVQECTWSWKTMGHMNGSEMDMVPAPNQSWLQGLLSPKTIPLVVCRPDISDLSSCIAERRPPQIASLESTIQ